MTGSNGKGLLILDHPPKSPTRGISVAFAKDIPVTSSSFYLLYEQEIIEKLDEDHYRFAQRLDWGKPPEKAMFEAWVYQSINKAIINRIECVAREISVAQQLGASYLTESEFESQICGMSSAPNMPSSQDVNAVNFLNANASYLKLEDPLVLAKMRTDHSKLFERWQLSLLAITDELNGVSDNFQEKAKQLFETEVRPQLDELNAALTKLAGGVGSASLLTGGTIGLALLSSSVALPFAAVLGLGAATAAGNAIPSVAEYIAKRRGPAFIWSKLSRRC